MSGHDLPKHPVTVGRNTQQTFGLPDITKITVVNQLHQDDVTSEDPLDLLRLSFANGQVVESVKDVTPEVQIVKSIKDLAVLA